MALNVDFTLDSFKVPGLANYENEIGTKKADGIGLTTEEIVDNDLMAWRQQKAVLASENISTGKIESDRKIFITQGDVTVTLGEGFKGCTVRITCDYANGKSYVVHDTLTDEVYAGRDYEYVCTNDGWRLVDGYEVHSLGERRIGSYMGKPLYENIMEWNEGIPAPVSDPAKVSISASKAINTLIMSADYIKDVVCHGWLAMNGTTESDNINISVRPVVYTSNGESSVLEFYTLNKHEFHIKYICFIYTKKGE